MPRDVAVEPLVNAEQPEQVRRDVVGRRATIPLPEQGAQVVCLAEDRALSDVKTLRKGLQMQETSCQLEIGIGNGAGGVVAGDQLVGDVLRPLHAPYHWVVGEPLPRLEGRGREPNAPCSFA